MTVSTSRPKRRSGERFRPATEADLDRDFFERNMAALAKHMPFVHRQVAAIGQPHSRLLISDRGDFDIEFGGARLYGAGARATAKRRVEDFFKAPSSGTRINIAAPSGGGLDEYAASAVHTVARRMLDDRIEVSAIPTLPCFHLVVLGIGLAEQLPLLIEKTDCHHIVLVEPNIEFVRHSLYTFNWVKFFQDTVADGRIISFNPKIDAKDIAVGIRDQLRFVNVAFIDGTFIFKSYQSSLMDVVSQHMASDINLFLTGLGFIDDEIDMVRNTYNNLKNYAGKFFIAKKHRCSLPAFVVASGPSIDNDLEFLRANADRAIVISCGTSMRILLRNGIIPDFHMEMENVPVITDVIKQSSSLYSLKDLTLVASTTIDPGVQPQFDRVIFYFRGGLASYPMFSPAKDTNMPHGLPTVSNLGLSFAQQIGCQTICLFGVDLGARDPKKHHSKDAPYEDGELTFDATIDKPVPGNLGGTVYSEFVYLWSRDQMQELILGYGPHRTYYNCSDGIRILGTTPKLSRTISLPPVPDKKAVVADILTRFDDYTPDMFAKAWRDRNVVLDLRAFQKRLLECCLPARRPGRSKPRQSPRIELDYMYKVVRTLIPTATDTTPEIHYYRGTMFMSMIGLHFYLTRIHSPKGRRNMARVVKEEFVKVIDVVAKRVIDFYRGLDPEKIAADEVEADKILGKSLRRLKAKLIPQRGKGRKSSRATRRPPGARKAPTRLVKTRPGKGPKRPPAKAGRGGARRRR